MKSTRTVFVLSIQKGESHEVLRELPITLLDISEESNSEKFDMRLTWRTPSNREDQVANRPAPELLVRFRERWYGTDYLVSKILREAH